MKKTRIAAIITIISFFGVIASCLAWCLTDVGALGFVTMAFALAFAVCTYLMTQGADA